MVAQAQGHARPGWTEATCRADSCGAQAVLVGSNMGHIWVAESAEYWSDWSDWGETREVEHKRLLSASKTLKMTRDHWDSLSLSCR